jgi:uncharacterized integral membrane protein
MMMKYLLIILFFLLIISNVSAVEFYIAIMNDNDYDIEVTVHGNHCYFDNGELGKKVLIPPRNRVEEYVNANETNTCYMNIIEAEPNVRFGSIVNDTQFVLEVGRPINIYVDKPVPLPCNQNCIDFNYIILAVLIIIILFIVIIVVIIKGRSEPLTTQEKYPTGSYT